MSSDTPRRKGRAPLSFDVLQRGAVAAVLLAVGLALIVGYVLKAIGLSHSVRHIVGASLAVVWAGGGVVFGASVLWTGVKRIHRPPVAPPTHRARRKLRDYWGRAWRLAAGWPAWIVQRWPMWALVSVSGPLVALFAFGVLSAVLVATLLTALSLVTFGLFAFPQGVALLRDVARDLALGPFLYVVCVYAFMGVFVAGVADWPTPGIGFFETAAQINATLLVAFGLTIAAPAAWRSTLRTHFAWLASGPVVATGGLAASIAGMVSDHEPTKVLFPLAVAPLGPAVLTLLVDGYYRLREKAEQETPSD